MKKNNKKGFTLIELVIVATIMVMIMGAILNWIRPMNRFYQRTQALADTNDIGSQLMDYVDDELRYATNVVVLQGYQGVPRLTNQMLTDSNGNAQPYGKFTNALILDNSAIRGSRFSGYVADSTVSRRKGARGCIISALITNDGIDTENMRCLGSEPLYNDYGCNFEASMKILENASCCVTVNMTLSRSRRVGANYVFDQPGYDQTRDFELVNVNLNDDDGMKASFFSSTGEGQAIDYNTFSRAADPGTNPQATESGMYLDDTFTYILYTKNPPITEQVKISLFEELNSANPLEVITVNAGSPIPSNIIDTWTARGQSSAQSNYQFDSATGKWKIKKFDGIKARNGNKDIEEFRESGVYAPTEFYILTSWEEKQEPDYTLTFYDRFDNAKNDWGDPPSFPMVKKPLWDDNRVVSNVSPGVGDANDEYTFVGWILDNKYPPAPGVYPDPNDPSGSKAAGWFVNDEEYYGDATYLAVYEKKPTVTLHFVAADDSQLSSDFSVSDVLVRIDEDYHTSDLMAQSIWNDYKDAFNNALNEGLTFKEWAFVNDDGSESKVSDVNINNLTADGTYRIKAYAQDNSHPGMFEVTLYTGNELSSYFAVQVQSLDGSDITYSIVEENDGGTNVIQPEVSDQGIRINGKDWNHGGVEVFHPNSTIRIYSKQPFKLYVGGGEVGNFSTDATVYYDFHDWQEYVTIG